VAYAWDGRRRAGGRGRVGSPPPHATAYGPEPTRQGPRILTRAAVSAFPEIDCLRHRLPPGLLLQAEQRAVALGIGADEVLVRRGVISADDYARDLAASLHLRFDTLERLRRADCPLPDAKLAECLASGLLLLRIDGQDIMVAAVHGLAARRLVRAYAGRFDRSRDVWITSPDCLQRFVKRHAYAAMVKHAADSLNITQPVLSAAPRGRNSFALSFAAGFAALVAGAWAWPAVAVALQVAITVLFLGWSALRLIGLVCSRPMRVKVQRVSDGALPVYSIIVALYRESEALPELARALSALDYPAEKLDIKIILEADDTKTLQVARALELGHPFEFIVAPAIGPRTKPKALNVALPFVRGEFVAVYDAEDRPEPNQLRLAVDAFNKGGNRLACVQAHLTIDNTRDNWLAGFFTAEYAGLFDVLLPSLCKFHLPIPLGGSSNHFRARVLRDVGAWDSYNVTEDADLGIRLARRGFVVGMIESTTYEEAPISIRPWIRQRTRWFKGWIQTWAVHMRQPRKLWRETGPVGFLAFQFMLFGTVLGALVQPYGLYVLLAWAATGTPPFGSEVIGWAHAAALLSGYAVSAALGLAGLRRRGLLATAWVLLLTPVHWMLLCWAAWRAVLKFFFDRYGWEKTEHGKARTSRRNAGTRAAA
jgi:glycosyltransferase XagB